MAEDEYGLSGAFLGAPTVGIEKICTGNEIKEAIDCILKLSENKDKKMAGFISCEIGGMNSVAPLYSAAQMGMPVIDADGMGRAFPEIQMFAPLIYGHKPTPSAVADEKGNKLTLMSVQNDAAKGVETALRSASMMYGLFVGLAFNPFEKEVVQKHFVNYSISRCWRLGRAILKARKEKTSPMKSMEEQENGKMLFKGKIVDMHRRIERGYNFGSIIIQGFDEYRNKKLHI